MNNHAHILKFDNSATQRFVELYLESIPLDEYITGAAQPKLNQKALNSIPIPFPSLPEQQRIVGILDEAFDGIATAKANAERYLQNARALFESHLQSVFTQRGEEGDLLVAMTEQAAGLLGSPILVPEPNKFLHNQRLGLVINKPGVAWTNEFFFHVFNTRYVRKEIHDSASGVKVRHTSPTKIGEVVVSFPTSVSEQMAIVAKLNDLDEETQRLESIYQQKLAALDELKKIAAASGVHRAIVTASSSR